MPHIVFVIAKANTMWKNILSLIVTSLFILLLFLIFFHFRLPALVFSLHTGDLIFQGSVFCVSKPHHWRLLQVSSSCIGFVLMFVIFGFDFILAKHALTTFVVLFSCHGCAFSQCFRTLCTLYNTNNVAATIGLLCCVFFLNTKHQWIQYSLSPHSLTQQCSTPNRIFLSPRHTNRDSGVLVFLAASFCLGWCSVFRLIANFWGWQHVVWRWW